MVYCCWFFLSTMSPLTFYYLLTKCANVAYHYCFGLYGCIFFYFGGWDGACCAVLEDKYGICYNSTLSERPATVTD